MFLFLEYIYAYIYFRRKTDIIIMNKLLFIIGAICFIAVNGNCIENELFFENLFVLKMQQVFQVANKNSLYVVVFYFLVVQKHQLKVMVN